MRHALTCLLCFCLSACSTTIERMTKGGPQGDTYTWLQNQIGGKGTWQNSMGSAAAFDLEKSLADTLQAVVAVKGFSAQTKMELARQVTERYKAGQITIQMRDKLMAAIATSETEAGLKIALAKIAAGE